MGSDSPLGSWDVPRPANGVFNFDPSIPLEFVLLRRFDESARTRHDLGGSVDLRGGTRTTLSVAYRYLHDDYSLGNSAQPAGTQSYGLNFTSVSSASAEFTVMPREGAMVFVNYSRDQHRFGYLGLGNLITGAVVDTTPCCSQYPIANTWDRRGNDVLDTLQVGVNTTFNQGRTNLDVRYILSNDKDEIHTSNPFQILANSPLTAGTYNYPDTINRLHDVDATVTRQLRAGMEIGLQYRFERYKLDDFFLNNLQPYPYGSVTAGGVPVNLQRTLLLDARFTDYDAHLASVFLRYAF